MNKEEKINILKEIYKIAALGMNSISILTEKIEEKKIKVELTEEYNKYKKTLDSANDELKQYDKIPDDTSITNKVMSWSGIQLNTLNDKTTSHIADMLIQGTTMGITQSIRLLHNNKDLDKAITSILTDFIDMQENNIEILKTYL